MDGVGREVWPGERCPERRAVPFVEDEVDHPQDGLQPIRQFLRARNLIGNSLLPDLRLGAHDPLRQRRRGGEEGTGDLLGREPADLAERQRNAGVLRERRVAASEDEPQQVIFQRVNADQFLDIGFRRQLRHRRREPLPSPDRVDRLEAPGRDKPRIRVVWHTVTLPSLDGDRERLVHRLLCEIEISIEQAHQRGIDTA